MDVLPQPASATVVPPRPTICRKPRRLTPLSLIKFPLQRTHHGLLVALPAVIWPMTGLVTDGVHLVILFMAADAPTHRNGLDTARCSHVTHVAVAVTASLPRGAAL